eukprot:SAG31_NODE_11977_length_980_cov_1.322361_1_plen_76_part_00
MDHSVVVDDDVVVVVVGRFYLDAQYFLRGMNPFGQVEYAERYAICHTCYLKLSSLERWYLVLNQKIIQLYLGSYR